MPDLPGPPEDLSDAEQDAWRDGAATVAELASQQFGIVAEVYTPDGDDADDDGCPACGGEIVEGFGGRVCMACGYRPDDDPAED